jgi:uncharacterized protein (DUF169 family)
VVPDVTQLGELVLTSYGFVRALRAEGGGHTRGRCQGAHACCGEVRALFRNTMLW